MLLQRPCEQAALSSQDPLEVKENYILISDTFAVCVILQEFLKTIAQITALEIRLLHVFCLLALRWMKLLIN